VHDLCTGRRAGNRATTFSVDLGSGTNGRIEGDSDEDIRKVNKLSNEFENAGDGDEVETRWGVTCKGIPNGMSAHASLIKNCS